MRPPAYIGRKLGNHHQFVRLDLSEVINRSAQLMVGITFIGFCIPRRGLLSAAAGMIGAALVYQGYTGRKLAQQLLSRSK